MKTEYNLKTDVKDTVKSWFKILLTDSQVDEFLKYWSDRFGKNMHVFDTVEREDFADYLGNKFLGKPWPIYGDGPDAGEIFIMALYEKLTDSEFELEKQD